MKQYEEKKAYEISFLVERKGGEASVEETLIQHGAEIINRSEVVETRLAYPIKKLMIAHFGFFHFKISPDMAEKITAALKLNPAVLRSLLITPPVVKSEGRRMMRREGGESSRPAENSNEGRPLKSAPKNVLTNKDLEDKLEEILK